MVVVEYLHLNVSSQVVSGKCKRTTHLHEDGSNKAIEIFYEFDSQLELSGDTLTSGWPCIRYIALCLQTWKAP